MCAGRAPRLFGVAAMVAVRAHELQRLELEPVEQLLDPGDKPRLQPQKSGDRRHGRRFDVLVVDVPRHEIAAEPQDSVADLEPFPAHTDLPLEGREEPTDPQVGDRQVVSVPDRRFVRAHALFDVPVGSHGDEAPLAQAAAELAALDRGQRRSGERVA
jgi:hypothetical protein